MTLIASASFAAPATAKADGVWVGLELGPGRAGGLRVKRVMEGSPGQEARIQPGEEVLSIDGRSVQTPEEMISAVQGRAPGSLVHLSVVAEKASSPHDVVVKVAARPHASDLQRGVLVGKAAPDFAAKVQSGPALDHLSALKGQVVLIDFWATWCHPCMAALPSVQALHARLGSKGLRVLGVTTDPPQVAAAAARARRLGYSIISDEDESISSSYRVYAIPTAVVIDKQGTVRMVSVSNLEAAERVVADLLAAP